MRLVTFSKEGKETLGALDPKRQLIADFSTLSADLPNDMLSFIQLGDEGIKKARVAIESIDQNKLVSFNKAFIKAPIPFPNRDIIAVGRNYYEHAKEFHNSGFDATSGNTATPDNPIIFTKATTSINGPFDSIPSYLDITTSTDYEGELAVIIGKRGRAIPETEAFDYVYGYSVSNDVTARTLQHQHKQWFIGKSLDGYCPMGPIILTSDEAGHPDTFHLRTTVNGEVRQDSNCAELIFSIPTLINCISSGMTLLPGDIILTGTPVGVGIGFDPPVFLSKGDIVEVTIDPIGTITNKVE